MYLGIYVKVNILKCISITMQKPSSVSVNEKNIKDLSRIWNQFDLINFAYVIWCYIANEMVVTESIELIYIGIDFGGSPGMCPQ